MLNILYVIVNYNSEEDSVRYLQSIQKSQDSNSGTVDIVLVDNSTTKSKKLRDTISLMDLNVTILDSDNVGYFGAFKVALESVGYPKVSTYDHVIISNVDLEVTEDFFSKLEETKVGTDIGVIAPSIVSKHRHNDLNPKIITKPSKSKILRNYMLFKYPFLFKFYAKLSDKKIKHNKIQDIPQIIYAPHGSFIIFNQVFFEQGGIIDYPVFLFGEEMYVAESMKTMNLKIQYNPNIKIFDFDHGSTSKENRSFISAEHRKALKYILKNYY